jgi:hypothetical protein
MLLITPNIALGDHADLGFSGTHNSNATALRKGAYQGKGKPAVREIKRVSHRDHHHRREPLPATPGTIGIERGRRDH